MAFFNCNILKGSVSRISGNTACGSEFSLGNEDRNGEILYRSFVNVSEKTHSLVVIAVSVTASQHPGALENVAYRVSGTVKYARKRTLIAIFVISDGIKCKLAFAVYGVLAAHIYVAQKCDGFAAEAIAARNERAKACKLIGVADIKLGFCVAIPLGINSAVPSIFPVCDKGDLREARYIQHKIAACGVVFKLIVGAECSILIDGNHFYSSTVFYVVEGKISAIKTFRHCFLQCNRHRNCIVL